MNERVLSGWKNVFCFTFIQGVKQKNYKWVTVGIAVLLFVVGLVFNVIMAINQKKDIAGCSELEVVHVINESGFQILYLDKFIETHKERYPNVAFKTVEGTVEEINCKIQEQTSQREGTGDVILHIEETGVGYRVNLYIPECSVINEKVGKDFLERVTFAMEQCKMLSSGISVEKLLFAMGGISAIMTDAGESEGSVGEKTVILVFPILLGFIIFLILLIYGQSVGNVVSMEKTTRLSELLLTMTSPASLIFGKVLAVVCITILQMMCCICGLVIGFQLGDMLAEKMIYPQYNNELIGIILSLKLQEGSKAFTMEGCMLAFLALSISLLFCFLLAGLIASFIAKPEDLAYVMDYYYILIGIGLLDFAVNTHYLEGAKDWLITILRIIPITSAIMLPGDIMVGNVSIIESIFYLLILLAFTIIMAIITGKVYKNQLFYKGAGIKGRDKKLH